MYSIQKDEFDLKRSQRMQTHVLTKREKELDTIIIISSFNIPYHTQKELPRNNAASISSEIVHFLS